MKKKRFLVKFDLYDEKRGWMRSFFQEKKKVLNKNQQSDVWRGKVTVSASSSSLSSSGAITISSSSSSSSRISTLSSSVMVGRRLIETTGDKRSEIRDG